MSRVYAVGKDETDRTRKKRKADILKRTTVSSCATSEEKKKKSPHLKEYCPRGPRYILHSAGNVRMELKGVRINGQCLRSDLEPPEKTLKLTRTPQLRYTQSEYSRRWYGPCWAQSLRKHGRKRSTVVGPVRGRTSLTWRPCGNSETGCPVWESFAGRVQLALVNG